LSTKKQILFYFIPKNPDLQQPQLLVKKNSKLFISGTLHIVNKMALLELNNIHFVPLIYLDNNATSSVGTSTNNPSRSNLAKQIYNQLQHNQPPPQQSQQPPPDVESLIDVNDITTLSSSSSIPFSSPHIDTSITTTSNYILYFLLFLN